MSNRPIIVHQSFFPFYEDLVANSQRDREKQLTTGLETASKAPNPGGEIKEISKSNLKGKIHKYHLGRSDYRLIYMIDTLTGKEIVLPFYISGTKKDDFEYSNIPQVTILRVLNALEDDKFETKQQILELIKKIIF